MTAAWNDMDQTFSPDMTVTTLGGAAKPGDLNGDGAVGVADLSRLLAQWGA